MDREAEQPLLDRFTPGWPARLEVFEDWVPKLIELDKKLALIDPDYSVQQIKEKFRELRFYYENSAGLSDEKKKQFSELIGELCRELDPYDEEEDED